MSAPANLTTTGGSQYDTPPGVRGNLPPTADWFFNKQLLLRARPYLIHHLPCQKSIQPEGTSEVGRWRRLRRLNLATTPLTEGVNPPGQQIQIDSVTVVSRQYGDYVTVSDKVTYIVSSPTLNDNVDLLAQQMGETHDAIVRDTMASTASTYTATNGGGTNTIGGASVTPLGALDIQKVCRTLSNASAKKFTSLIKASTGVGTTPVRPAYWALGHTDISVDLENLAKWIPVANYSNNGNTQQAEIGSYNSARFLLSPLGKTQSNGATDPASYNVFFCGMDAVGITEIGKGNVKHIFHQAGQGGVGGPLGLFGTQGWKSFVGQTVLNPAWIINAKCTINN